MSENKKTNLRRDIQWRVKLLFYLMVLLSFGIIFKILYIQTIEHSKWLAEQKKISQKDILIKSNRGDIISSDGKLLASSVPYYEIRIDTKSDALTDKVFNENVDSLAWYLSNLFKDRTKRQYKKLLIDARKKGNRYKKIKSNIDYGQLKKVKTFPIFRLGKYKGGLIVIQKNIRKKPFGEMASRTIGYLISDANNEKIGRVGLEGAFNTQLKGRNGLQLMQKLSGGIWMPIRGGEKIEAEDGNDIITTIDVKMQDIAHHALLKQLIENDAEHGTVVVMEVATGKIRAIANLGIDKNGHYREDYNYAIGESSEPGSTFKLPSLIVALEDGVIKITDTVDVEGGIKKYYNQTMRDSHYGLHKLTVKEIFEKSSNVGVSKIIDEHYKKDPKRFIERLYQLNLNQKLGLSIIGEGVPDIKYPGDDAWSGVSLAWMAIGYELRLTPLQILTFYNAVANDGVMVKPRFLEKILFHGEVIEKYKTEIINPSICSEKTLKTAQELLLGVVENGTARNLKNKNYKIAGKTGTAQIAHSGGGYTNKEGRKDYKASFVGYFPADNPRYSCIVVVTRPKKLYYGNQVAGPVFKEVADKIYSTSLDMINYDNDYVADVPYSRNANKDDLKKVLSEFNIAYKDKNTETEWVKTEKKDSLIQFYNVPHINKENIVPNLKGMGAKDVLYLLENKGLRVTINGSGSVIWQSLQPGQEFYKGQRIIIELG